MIKEVKTPTGFKVSGIVKESDILGQPTKIQTIGGWVYERDMFGTFIFNPSSK